MKLTHAIATLVLMTTGTSFAATGIFGSYVTVGGTKYKSFSSYGGAEPNFNGADLGDITIGTSSLTISQFETLTFQNSEHSTFDFAFAYRVRLASDAQSTNPGDYTFVGMGNGVGFGGGGDEKAEVTGATINLLSGISAPAFPTTVVYAVDIIHKAGAYEGGSNFERLANVNNANPGSTSWGSTDAFTATFTVVPEPASATLGLIGAALLLRRRRA
jgi:hypothetical protein